MISVEVQRAFESSAIPSNEQFQAWAAVVATKSDQVISIRIVDEDEITKLNEKYRKKSATTNVLAFPAEIPAGVDLPFIGDIVMCAPIVAKQAAEQGKSPASHWAHMTLHGILHLQGYDHIDAADAEIMESLEVQLMHKLGFANPYV